MDYNFAQRMGGMQASAIREILKFTADPTVISFAAGSPSKDAFPVELITSISNDILTKDPITALQYNITEGYMPLRNNVKELLKKRNNIGKESDDVIITSGAQQAIEHTCKALCNPGDTIICENPSFVGSLNAFKSYGVNLVGVEIEDDGISVDGLKEALERNKNTKIIYLIPNFQNPTGITMSLEKRKAIYALAVEYSVVILEDNPYGELRFSGEDIPNIKSFDEEGIVVYCGTFSKVLSPGLRVGYICANKSLIEKVVILKQVSDVHTNIFAQMICCEFLNRCDYDKHIASLRELYKNKCYLMLNTAKRKFNPKVTLTNPEGGLFIWATLPDGVNMTEFCKKAVMNKVAVVPGVAFLPRDEYKSQSFRLNFSTPTDQDIVKGIEILGELTHDMI